jgi:hypothetical protein
VNKENPMTKVITPEAVISYPHIFEPQTPPGASEPVYSCALVFKDDVDITDMKAAVMAVAKEKWGDKTRDLLKAGKIRLPFREDAVDKGYPEGSTFINVKSKQQPGVVSIFAGENGKPAVITNPAEIYPGAVVKASLRAYAYSVNGNNGVAFSLGNLQKTKDGPRMDGRLSAADEFTAEAKPTADISDLDDLI